MDRLEASRERLRNAQNRYGVAVALQEIESSNREYSPGAKIFWLVSMLLAAGLVVFVIGLAISKF